MKQYVTSFFLLFIFIGSGQQLFSSLTIPAELKEKANSVLLNEKVIIDIPKQDEMTRTLHREILVLNKSGVDDINAYVYYDKAIKVKQIEAKIYNQLGVELKKIKKKDFNDVSAVDGGTLYSDNRVLYLDYTPTEYPFTVVFDYVVQSNNTFAIPDWYTYNEYNSSIASKSLEVRYDPALSLRFKVIDDDEKIKVDNDSGSLKLSIKNAPAIEHESYGPAMSNFIPHVMLAMSQFHYEGISGEATNWNDLGKWFYKHLVSGLDELPQETVSKVNKLLADADSEKEKIRRIYQYVQNNTRYISVQLGIGGLRPYPAEQVDKLGYGDCKGLTNYTKALLKSQNIESFYTVVTAGQEQLDLDADFSSLQGNHVILNVPLQDEDVWLECTSQTMPFNFLGDFTDDRNVLVVSEAGGKIRRTPKYDTQKNTMNTTGECVLMPNGDIAVNVSIQSKGVQYDQRSSLERQNEKDKQESYKEYWHYITDMAIESMNLQNDKETILLDEKVQFKARSYGDFAGEKMLLPLNVLNRIPSIPKRYKNRSQEVHILRGFLDTDEVTIALPVGFQLSSLPPPVDIENQFGMYHASVTKNEEGVLIYQRRYSLNTGQYPKETYKEFRSFLRKVARYDNQKIVLTKI